MGKYTARARKRRPPEPKARASAPLDPLPLAACTYVRAANDDETLERYTSTSDPTVLDVPAEAITVVLRNDTDFDAATKSVGRPSELGLMIHGDWPDFEREHCERLEAEARAGLAEGEPLSPRALARLERRKGRALGAFMAEMDDEEKDAFNSHLKWAHRFSEAVAARALLEVWVGPERLADEKGEPLKPNKAGLFPVDALRDWYDEQIRAAAAEVASAIDEAEAAGDVGRVAALGASMRRLVVSGRDMLTEIAGHARRAPTLGKGGATSSDSPPGGGPPPEPPRD